MKKLLLAALLAIVSVGASAQIEKGLRYGIQVFGGINSVGETGYKAAFSYGAGLVVDQNFSEKFYLETGLNLQNKGWKADFVEKTVNVLYLTLPVHLGGRVDIGNDIYFHFQGGPQVSYGLIGNKIDFGNYVVKYSDYGKRFELGAGAKIGVETDNFQINLSGNYGFSECMQVGGHNLNITLGVAFIM